jgi:hypothetical protein
MRLEISGEYPPNWKTISLEAKVAAGYRCVRCRHSFSFEGVPLFCVDDCDLSKGRHGGDAITWDGDPRLPGLNYGVHHLDGDKSNCRWWNLLPLCNSCHLKIQSRVIPERPWLFEHSEWFKPYAGGFYAFWFAKLEPTRLEVEADVDRFLALGQPWLYPEELRARYVDVPDPPR